MTATPSLPVSYAMFSDAGNQAVREAVAAVFQAPTSISDADLLADLRQRFDTIARTHPEVWDTAVRESAIGAVENATGRDLTIFF